MSFYENRVLPRLINIACGSKPTRKQREKVVPRAYGDVLEIGFGGGLNLAHYDRDKVRKVFGLEPSAGMRRSAADNVAASGMDVELIDLPGEEIPLDDNAVDSVLVTYTLCTIPDAVAALQGMRRVLKPTHLPRDAALHATIVHIQQHFAVGAHIQWLRHVPHVSKAYDHRILAGWGRAKGSSPACICQ